MLFQTEPITFLKCDHECHEEIVRTDQLKQISPNSQKELFVSSELATYETELDKLCRFQTCYMICMAPVVKEVGFTLRKSHFCIVLDVRRRRFETCDRDRRVVCPMARRRHFRLALDHRQRRNTSEGLPVSGQDTPQSGRPGPSNNQRRCTMNQPRSC